MDKHCSSVKVARRKDEVPRLEACRTRGSVCVFFLRCVANFPRRRGLKQHLFTTSQPLSQRSNHGADLTSQAVTLLSELTSPQGLPRKGSASRPTLLSEPSSAAVRPGAWLPADCWKNTAFNSEDAHGSLPLDSCSGPLINGSSY